MKTENKEYAGIGARDTPGDICVLMRNLAAALEKVGYHLRSGGARGADSAFESGVAGSNKSIYLPHKGFNNSTSNLYESPSEAAMDWAGKAHPYFHRMKDGFSRNAHARNANQVLGDTCTTPCRFVICWTPDGAEHQAECHSTEVTGGTRTAIVIADMNGIPVFNLARPDAVARLRALVKGLEAPPREDWSPDPSVINAVIEKKRAAKNEKRSRSTGPTFAP
jgi:hypothetical protein